MNTDRFKFRIWDDTHKCYIPNSDAIIDGRTGKKFHGPIFSAVYIVEQCTGLKDRNGKLIYEGDVVVFADGATHPIEVFWNGIGWKFKRNGAIIKDAFESNTIDHIQWCGIIGNIHEEQSRNKQPEFTEDVFCSACGRRIASGTYCSNCEDQEW